MSFKKYLESVLRTEITETILAQGYLLETEFCDLICAKYNLDIYTVRPVLRRIYPEMSLMKRHITNELKRFYKLEFLKGSPIVYLPLSE